MERPLNLSVRRLTASTLELSWSVDKEERLSKMEEKEKERPYTLRIVGSPSSRVLEASFKSERQSVVLGNVRESDVFSLSVWSGSNMLLNASIPVHVADGDVSASQVVNQGRLALDMEEGVIVSLILLLWACAVVLFVRRWGKIRMLVPHQPRYAYEQAPTADQFKPFYLYGRRPTTTVELMESGMSESAALLSQETTLLPRRHSSAVMGSRFAAAAFDVAASCHSLNNAANLALSLPLRPRPLPRPLEVTPTKLQRLSTGESRSRSALDLRAHQQHLDQAGMQRRPTAIAADNCGLNNVANVAVIVEGLPQQQETTL